MSDNTGQVNGPHGERETLDLAIDRAIRRMMAAEPPAGFRHRVLARLRTTEASVWGFFPRFALAGAALAIIVVGVAVMTRPAVPMAPPAHSAAATPPGPSGPGAESLPAAQPQVDPGATTSATVPPPRLERLPEPPRMAEIFGARDTRVASTSVGLSEAPLDDPRTPYTEPGTTFRSPIAGLPPMRLEHLRIPPVQTPPFRNNPQ